MDDAEVKTAIVGLGRWGKTLAREFGEGSLVAYAAGGSVETREWADANLPGAARMGLDQICADETIQAAVVATPIATHFEIARALLRAGKHVFVEKPLAGTSAEAQELADMAAKRKRVIATGYTFLYHPVYDRLKRELEGKAIRKAHWTWKKYGTFAEDIEANLLTHHLAIALDLFGDPRAGRVARGEGIVSSCDRIETRLSYPGFDVRSSIDRASDERSHTLRFTLSDDSSLVWDGAKLKDGSGRVLFEDDRPPVAIELGAFVDAVRNPSRSLPSGGDFGARVLLLDESLER